jgi:DNA-binding NarL/FixJ family response regulator
MTHVLIADDHPLVREALSRTLQALELDLTIAEADSRESLFEAVRTRLPDLALLDLNMPGMNGTEGLRQLRAAWPTLAIVVASGQDDVSTIRTVMSTGVSGFIPKSESPALIAQAIRLVLAGGVYVPVRSLAGSADEAPSLAMLRAGDPDHGMTPRQLDVLHLLLRGLPNKSIARELGLTEGTVKVHLAAILRALAVRNRTEAVVKARELGIVAPR